MGDETYSLPVCLSAPPVEPPGLKELEYLVGFFDGDGCVSFWGGRMVLHINQNVDSARVLLCFRQAFGGSITVSGQPTGRNKGVLKWRVYGENARKAAG